MFKVKISYILIAVVVIVALGYFLSNSDGTLKKRNSDFAVVDVDKITEIKIFSNANELMLKKEFNSWKVNNKYQVKDNNIENLLAVINRISLLSPVSKVEREQVATILKSDGSLVEIRKGNRVLKRFYVSKPAMNKNRTYMMMEKSEEPYIVHIPSSKELVASWFVINENYWRDKTIFNYKPQEIKSIAIEYPSQNEKSFRLINYNDGTFTLQSVAESEFIENFDVEKVARYFTYYQGIVFENVLSDFSNNYIDSVKISTPQLIISVESVNGNKNSLKIFRKPAEKELDEFGQKAKYDYNRAYAVFNESSELILIQYYIFDPLFKEIDYFR